MSPEDLLVMDAPASSDSEQVGDFLTVADWGIPADKQDKCGGCRDEPYGWKSSTGMTCRMWDGSYCKNGAPIAGKADDAFFNRWKGTSGISKGFTGGQACCACGGGNNNYKYDPPLAESADPEWPASPKCPKIPDVTNSPTYEGGGFISGEKGSVTCPDGWNMLSMQWQCKAAATALGRKYKKEGCFADIGVQGCFLNGKDGEEELQWNECDKGNTKTTDKNMPVCTFKSCPKLGRAPIDCMDDSNREVCDWQKCEVCETRCSINRRLPSSNFPLNPKERNAGDKTIYRNFYLQLASTLRDGPSWTAEKGFAANFAGTSTCVAISTKNQLELKTSKANCDQSNSAGRQLKVSAQFHAYKKDSFYLSIDDDKYGCGVQVLNKKDLVVTKDRAQCPGSRYTNWFDLKMIDGMEYGLSADNKMGGPFSIQSRDDATKCIGVSANVLTLTSCGQAAKFYWRAAVTSR